MAYLDKYSVIRTSNLDELHDAFSHLSVPHFVEVLEERGGFDAQISLTELERLQIAYVSYGDARIQIRSPAEDDDGFLLCAVTNGHGLSKHAGHEWTVSEDVGVCREYGEPLIADQQDLACFGINLSRDVLVSHARTLLGDTPNPCDLKFDTVIDYGTPEGRLFKTTLIYAAELLNGPLREFDNPFLRSHIEDLLLTQIMTMLPNTLKETILGQDKSKALPFYVKRARDYIYENAHKKIRLEDLSQAAGCGYRTLQSSFRDAFDMSPMDYVRNVRLMHVRKALSAADSSASVSEIAKQWGFSHMGRFSQAYRQQFGELPSETLRLRA